MTSTSSTPLATLLGAGIITADQHMRALSHPDYTDVAGEYSLAEHLMWLCDEEIVDEATLKRATEHVNETFSGEEQARYVDAIEEAQVSMLDLDEHQKACFQRPVDMRWITQDECDRALAAIGPREAVFADPVGVLGWMIDRRVIPRSRLATIRAATAGGDAQQAALLAELDEGLTRRARLARWRWAKAAGILGVAGSVAWMIFSPASVPACTAGGTRGTVERLVLSSSLDKIGSMKPNEAIPQPSVESISEIGYAGAPRVRACKGTAKLDGKSIPFAFTIAPAPEGKKGFLVTGAHEALLQMRFRHVDADGNYANKAEPLGRAEVERALRAGFAGNKAGEKEPFDINAAIGRKFGVPYDARERTREIAEVEPLGPCRAVQPGRVYRCPLMVERNDPVLAMTGRPANMLLTGEFTFERSGPTEPWHTTPALYSEMMRSVLFGRLK